MLIEVALGVELSSTVTAHYLVHWFGYEVFDRVLDYFLLLRRHAVELRLLRYQGVVLAVKVLEALDLGPLALVILLPVSDLRLQVFNLCFEVLVRFLLFFKLLVSFRALACPVTEREG